MLYTTYFETYESRTLQNFCESAQLHKNINSLYGLIVGIQANGHIKDNEIELLRFWVNSLGTLKSKAPYHKLVAKINDVLENGIVTDEEAENLIWICRGYLDYRTNPYYDVITSGTQQLGGFLAGISTDNAINTAKLNPLRNWSSENSLLFNTWPSDSLFPAIEKINMDKQLSIDEHSGLLSFCCSVSVIKSVGEVKPETVPTLATKAVSIIIQDSTFCLTGESPNYTRKELAKSVEMYDGVAAASVTIQLRCLFICYVPNPS